MCALYISKCKPTVQDSETSNLPIQNVGVSLKQTAATTKLIEHETMIERAERFLNTFQGIQDISRHFKAI